MFMYHFFHSSHVTAFVYPQYSGAFFFGSFGETTKDGICLLFLQGIFILVHCTSLSGNNLYINLQITFKFYQIFIICCIIRLTIVIPHQHDAPTAMGFPPVLISCIILLFNPIAAIAIIIKNFDNSLSGWNTSALIPICTQMVVMIAAPPTTGNIFPRIHDGIAIARQIRIPLQFFFIKFI